MKKIKIVAEEKLRGIILNLPEIGKTEIPKDGILEIREDVANALVNSKMGYTHEGVDIVKEDSGDVKEASEDPSKALEKLNLDDLIDLAKQSELPESEWLKLSQNTKKARELMIKYLSKNLK